MSITRTTIERRYVYDKRYLVALILPWFAVMCAGFGRCAVGGNFSVLGYNPAAIAARGLYLSSTGDLLDDRLLPHNINMTGLRAAIPRSAEGAILSQRICVDPDTKTACPIFQLHFPTDELQIPSIQLSEIPEHFKMG